MNIWPNIAWIGLLGIVSYHDSPARAQAFSVLPPYNIDLSTNPGTFPRQSLVAGDYNRDGKLDLLYVATDLNQSFVSVSLGNGDGTFQPPRRVVTLDPTVGFATAIASADVNHDGRLDLLLLSGTGSNRLLAFLGNGDATFQGAIETILPALPLDQTPPLLLLSDLNADGNPDVVVGGSVLLGNGTGRFTIGPALGEVAYLLTDLNGDGVPDLITHQSSTYYFSVRIGIGDGTFAAPIPLDSSAQGSYLASGDLNGDGFNDLVFSQPSYKRLSSVDIVTMLGRGDGTFQSPQHFQGAGGPVLIADLNRDGKQDLVSSNQVMSGNGDGTFFPAITFLDASSCLGPNCSAAVVSSVAGDFNGDGLTDLASAYQITLGFGPSLTVSVILNASPGDGFTVPGVSAATGQSPVGFQSIVTAFGVNMTSLTEAATTTPLPTTLGGVRVHIGGSLAPLYYVSPGQINFALPPDAIGTISLEQVGKPFVPKGVLLPIVADAPGLFTVNSSGLAAASATRLTANGLQPVSVASCSATGCVPVPVDVSGDPVYLSLFGTGFSIIDGSYGPYSTTCNSTPTKYFGSEGLNPGLDQINWLLPGHLPSGKYPISCRITGAYGSPPQPNTVFIEIQ